MKDLVATPILQNRLSFAPWADPRTRRLPGVIPVTYEDWLEVDDAYAAQMGLRDRLIGEARDLVLGLSEHGRPAAEELYDLVLPMLPALGFAGSAETVTRPDGAVVALDRADPLATLGRLLQCDLCLMEADEAAFGHAEHVLTGGALCFPSGWTLREKFMRPMMRIHEPIEIYTDDLGKRVQRLLDGVREGRGLMRGTASRSAAHLHDPRSEYEFAHAPADAPYIRVERQCLFRLPRTNAVIFSIHTQVVRPESLSPDQAQALAEHPIRQAD
ncbi:hypothetical protein BMI86_01745 [Thioclava sp. DLFJ5-1]|uniref:heme-dependent oxidative N-demethylase family protein n=1 Tax=Thioclava sp. DLFJ5-1 TaxID=1915314 RepID=UPI000998179E|nr:DUF3445 domain-containing protein [Thioclava sp. DLFJ5-1]OOY22360.1 hypothetical protein BMI86_01745 [Thioclava sp. DLFJ5-1]